MLAGCENHTRSMKVKVFQDGLLECRRHCLYFVLFWVFASVLDEESLDSKVLVQNKD